MSRHSLHIFYFIFTGSREIERAIAYIQFVWLEAKLGLQAYYKRNFTFNSEFMNFQNDNRIHSYETTRVTVEALIVEFTRKWDQRIKSVMFSFA